MAKTLIKTSTNNVTYSQALQYINKGNKTSYTTVALAVAGLGISLATAFFSGGLSIVVAATLNALGISLGAAALASTFQSRYKTQLQNAIKKLKAGGYIKIKTLTYRNISGSGNSTWLSTDHVFTVHN